jgi:hypothetical protein
MVVKLNARLEGAAALFTELVELKWDGPCIIMRGRSGDYIANGHMTPQFAMELYERLGRLLAEPGADVQRMPRRRRKKH